MKITKNKSMVIIFLAPALFLYLFVFLYPTTRTFIMSFFKVEGVTDALSTWRFDGLDNFQTLFSTPLFVSAMKNIGLIWLVGGIGVLLISLLFGVILTSGVLGKSFLRSVIYLPNVISAVAMGTMWINYVYNPDFGLFNSFLKLIGQNDLAKTQWTGPEMVFWSMLIAYCFGMVGYHMLIWMSGIERIPVDFFEAAKIEGANVFQRFSKITLPLL